MTEAEKTRLVQYREQGKGCAEIARLMNLSVNTVKSFLRRNKVHIDSVQITLPLPAKKDMHTGRCRQCGIAISQSEHSREKLFCSDKCRLQWWHEHRGDSKRAVERICPECSKVFSTDRTQKYCSHECYILARFGRKRINEAGTGAV